MAEGVFIIMVNYAVVSIQALTVGPTANLTHDKMECRNLCGN